MYVPSSAATTGPNLKIRVSEENLPELKPTQKVAKVKKCISWTIHYVMNRKKDGHNQLSPSPKCYYSRPTNFEYTHIIGEQ